MSTQLLQVQNQQRQQARRATLEDLRGKKPKRDEFQTKLDPDAEPVTFLFVALKPTEYEELVSAHPPTDEQRTAAIERGERVDVNPDTFQPALLARVCKDPAIDEATWAGLWDDESWSRGELMSLFWRANGLCNQPLDLGPLGPASAPTPTTGSSSSSATSEESRTPDS